jgi:hypothetical protein
MDELRWPRPWRTLSIVTFTIWRPISQPGWSTTDCPTMEIRLSQLPAAIGPFHECESRIADEQAARSLCWRLRMHKVMGDIGASWSMWTLGRWVGWIKEREFLDQRPTTGGGILYVCPYLRVILHEPLFGLQVHFAKAWI